MSSRSDLEDAVEQRRNDIKRINRYVRDEIDRLETRIDGLDRSGNSRDEINSIQRHINSMVARTSQQVQRLTEEKEVLNDLILESPPWTVSQIEAEITWQEGKIRNQQQDLESTIQIRRQQLDELEADRDDYEDGGFEHEVRRTQWEELDMREDLQHLRDRLAWMEEELEALRLE